MNEIIMSIKSTGRLKKEALINLKGKWGAAVLISFIAILLTDIFLYSSSVYKIWSMISNPLYDIGNFGTLTEENQTSIILYRIGMLIKLLIGGCVTYGLYNFFLNLSRGNDSQIENIFSGFKYFGKNFLIQLITYIFTFLWAIVIYIPAVIILLIATVSSGFGFAGVDMLSIGSSMAIILINIIVFIAVYILIYIIVARYEMALFIANDNPELASMQCINASKGMMDGNCIRYFLLNLSFIGWDILSILTLGLGYLWLRPYKYAVKANFYMNLKNECNLNEGTDFKADENIHIEDEFKEI